MHEAVLPVRQLLNLATISEGQLVRAVPVEIHQPHQGLLVLEDFLRVPSVATGLARGIVAFLGPGETASDLRSHLVVQHHLLPRGGRVDRQQSRLKRVVGDVVAPFLLEEHRRLLVVVHCVLPLRLVLDRFEMGVHTVKVKGT